MLFYRLQDKEWELEENWQSYCYRWDSLEQAMLADIEEEWGMDNLAEELREKYNDDEIHDAWWKLVDEGNRPFNAHAGASCFSDKERLIRYIKRESFYNDDEYEVVEFEGEWGNVPEGMDGEDIAVVKKEVKRIPIEDFIKDNQ